MSDISTTAKVTLLVNGEQARKIISDINTKLVAAEEVIRLSNQNADPRLENIPIYPNKACPYHLTVVLQHPPYHLTIHPASGNFHFSFFNFQLPSSLPVKFQNPTFDGAVSCLGTIWNIGKARIG